MRALGFQLISGDQFLIKDEDLYPMTEAAPKSQLLFKKKYGWFGLLKKKEEAECGEEEGKGMMGRRKMIEE